MKRLLEELNTPVVGNNHDDNSDDESYSDKVTANDSLLVRLYYKVLHKEKQEAKAIQGVMHSWIEFVQEFEYQINERLRKYKSRKKATTKVYNLLEKRLRVSREVLRTRMSKAYKVHRLFGAIGVDKIERVKTITANMISNFSPEQIELVIDIVNNN
jgi:hypothetical protein